MALTFNIIGVLAVFYGIFIGLLAKSAIHEIESFIIYLIAAVLLVGAAIVNQIGKLAPVTPLE